MRKVVRFGREKWNLFLKTVLKIDDFLIGYFAHYFTHLAYFKWLQSEIKKEVYIKIFKQNYYFFGNSNDYQIFIWKMKTIETQSIDTQ